MIFKFDSVCGLNCQIVWRMIVWFSKTRKEVGLLRPDRLERLSQIEKAA